MPATNVAQKRVKAIYERETKRFHRDRPKSAALLNRAETNLLQSNTGSTIHLLIRFTR